MSTGEEQAPDVAVPAEQTTEAASPFAAMIEATKEKVHRELTSTDKKKQDGWWGSVVEGATAGDIKFKGTAVRSIDDRIKMIDAEMSEQLAVIMHHEEFQKLEGTWAGLRQFVYNTNTDPNDLFIDVFNCSKEELLDDMRNNEPHLSDLHRQTYTDSFGTAGGVPHGILVGDYQFTNHPDDIFTLKQVTKVASLSHTPFLTSPGPGMFGFDSWQQLESQNNETMANIFADEVYTEWNELREMEDSRYLVMAMPRVLSRLPYGENTNSVKEFGFEEVKRRNLANKDDPDQESYRQGGSKDYEAIEVANDQFTWMNAAYSLAERITNAFWEYGWTTAIRGEENGGKVEGLPTYAYKATSGDTRVKCPTEINLSWNQDLKLSDLGFYGLVHVKGTNGARFEGGQTVQKPQEYVEDDANANAKLSARLPYILAASRLAHYLKKMAHDHIGTFKERDECEKWLHNWVHQYVLNQDGASDKVKATYPFRAAKVVVEEVPGDKGVYHATIEVQPWIMLESLTANISMVGELDRQ